MDKDKNFKEPTSAECEAARRYRVIFDQSPDGILIIDANGKIIEFNEAAHRQLGYSREEFAKLSIRDIEAFETPEQIKESIREMIGRGKGEFEVHHRTKSGEIRNTLVITQTMTLEGNVVFHTIFRDVTEQKKAQEKLRTSYR
jgi:PAS domain S-box-containing protein